MNGNSTRGVNTKYLSITFRLLESIVQDQQELSQVMENATDQVLISDPVDDTPLQQAIATHLLLLTANSHVPAQTGGPNVSTHADFQNVSGYLYLGAHIEYSSVIIEYQLHAGHLHMVFFIAAIFS